VVGAARVRVAGVRVLVWESSDSLVEPLRELLADVDVTVEEGPPPWTGEDVVGLVVWRARVGEEELARLPSLRVVVTPSVGYDHIDLEAARRRGVCVCNVPDYCVDEMADSSLALLLALLRGVVVLERSVREGGWDYEAAGPLRRLAGTRLGVVGFGRIGRALAARAQALGFEVWAADPAVAADEIAAAGVRPAPLGELLAACEAVSLHAPLTPSTEGLLGSAELALMPAGAVLLNTARAELVDQEALLAALADGRLAAAAVDVLPVEPPTAEQPAPQAPRLVVTPHAGWYSPDAEQEVVRRTALAVRTVLEGRTPENALVPPAPAGTRAEAS
jgi:D-3-phosphoglycerate dehydrogenase / 2-oxoglutarate reductase